MSTARRLVTGVRAHMVTSQWASRVVSSLHDVLTEAERRAILAENPDSFLHVTSDPLALPEPPGEGAAETAQARALARLLELGAYLPVPEPALFVYRMGDAGREHTGVIASVAVEGFADGRVLGHEAVQPDRVDGLLRHYRQVPMRSELVALFHPPDPVVTELTARVVERPALLTFHTGGVAQSVWQAEPDEAATLGGRLDRHLLYIADGHHRVAAAIRRWEQEGRPVGAAALCAVYPQDQIDLHAFHRRVRGPVDVGALLEGLSTGFRVTDGAGPSVGPGTIGLYAAGRWHELRPREEQAPPGVAGLDVTLLDQQVLRPLLHIAAGDPRLEFVPALRDLDDTQRRCDHETGVLFTLHPPTIEDLKSVAERHEVMSAKTTYVQPKPHTGIFLS